MIKTNEVTTVRGAKVVITNCVHAETGSAAAELVTIDGITYEVVTATTPDSADAKGLANVAAMMRERGQTRQLGLRRPKGRVIYYSIEFANTYQPGTMAYSSVVSLGGSR